MAKKIKAKKLTEVDKLKQQLEKETARANTNYEVANRNELVIKKIEALFPESPRPSYDRNERSENLFDKVLGVITDNARLCGETAMHVHAVKLMANVVKWHIDPASIVEKRPEDTMGRESFPRSKRY